MSRNDLGKNQKVKTNYLNKWKRRWRFYDFELLTPASPYNIGLDFFFNLGKLALKRRWRVRRKGKEAVAIPKNPYRQ